MGFALLVVGPASSESRPLTTGLADWIDSYPDPTGALMQAKRAGMTTVDVMINWAEIAPAASEAMTRAGPIVASSGSESIPASLSKK